MQFRAKEKLPYKPEEWHWRFALWPTRTNANTITWLGWYQRRLCVISEGNWAGGFQFKWQYANPGGLWEGPLHTD